MPGCNNKTLVEIFRLKWENTFESGQSAWTKAKNIGLDSVLDYLETAGGSMVSTIMSDISNISVFNGVTNLGNLVAQYLTSGTTSYLSMSAYVLTLLRQELEKRYVTQNILLNEIIKIKEILRYMDIKDVSDPNDNQELQKAYNKVFTAYYQISSAARIYRSQGTYNRNLIENAQTNLDAAKAYLDSPVAQAITGAIKDSKLYINLENTYEKIITDMNDVVSDLQFNYDNRNSETTIADRAAAELEETEDLLASFGNFIKDYLGYPTTLAELMRVVVSLAITAGKYLPIDPTQKYAMLLNLFGEGGFEGAMEKNVSKRPLKVLNDSIETRIGFISNFENQWDGLNALGVVLSGSLDSVESSLKDVSDDMEKYVKYTKKSPTAKNPLTQFTDTAAKTIKMSLWKTKIDTISKNISTADYSVATQVINTKNAYDLLDTIMNTMLTEQEAYGDTDVNSPLSGAAYNQTALFIAAVFGISSYGFMNFKSMHTQAADAYIALTSSMEHDMLIINKIKNFCNIVWVIPGISGEIGELENYLKEVIPPGKIGDKIRDLIGSGDLQAIISMAVSTLSESGIDLLNNVLSSDTFAEFGLQTLEDLAEPVVDLVECISSYLSESEDARTALSEQTNKELEEQEDAIKDPQETKETTAVVLENAWGTTEDRLGMVKMADLL